MRDHLLVFINGQPTRVGGEDAFLTLAEFLRRRKRLIGTKIVCAEGDCGSCAVIIGRVTPDGKSIAYAAVTSCIILMFQLDACHVITIEGIRDGAELNPIQKSMIACHGAQCGFCTPGFVVSLYDLMQDGRAIDAHSVRRGLVGNLCRCTGYDSIIRAALQADRSALKSIPSLYPTEKLLHYLAPACNEEVKIEHKPWIFYKPISIEAAAKFRREHPGCVIVSGATDVGVQRNKGLRSLTVVLSTSGLCDLRAIRVNGDHVHVGAGATLSDLERVMLDAIPKLGEFLAWFGSPLIKNAGTLAGNLVNASPIGDTLPPLMVLGASVELASPTGSRWIDLEKFYKGYRLTVLEPDELLKSVRIPLPAAGEVLKLYKVSKRKDLDISSFSAAFWMRRAGDAMADLRIAFGGVGPTVLRMRRAEQILRGQVPTRGLFDEAADAAFDDVTPITDVRGSEQYRRMLARNIFRKFWSDLWGGHANGSPVPIDAEEISRSGNAPAVAG